MTRTLAAAAALCLAAPPGIVRAGARRPDGADPPSGGGCRRRPPLTQPVMLMPAKPAADRLPRRPRAGRGTDPRLTAQLRDLTPPRRDRCHRAGEHAPAMPALPTAGAPATASERRPGIAGDGALPPPLPAPLAACPPASSADLAYGAFQRGLYLTAFDIALPRAEAGDAPPQTLLGVIYEGGYGVPQDFAKAVDWYELAADGGDREAQFALGMMYLEGRGVRADRAQGRRTTSRRPPSQGQVERDVQSRAALSRGHARPRDAHARPACCNARPPGGSPDAQYVLAQLYAIGDGVPRTRSRAAAAVRRRGPPEPRRRRRSNTPSACSTASASPRTRRPRSPGSSRAADLGNPIAQNRLARILADRHAACRPTRSAAAK